VEKPRPEKAPSNLAITGVTCCRRRFLIVLARTKPGAGNEIQLTDALRILAQEDGLWAYITTGISYDAGDKLGFLKATVEIALQNSEFGGDFPRLLEEFEIVGATKSMSARILGIESSCDETAAAVVADGREILSSVVASQIDIHRKYGGVVPELASREHLRQIVPVVREALEQAGMKLTDVDAIGVTQGPGLLARCWLELRRKNAGAVAG